jgi:excisionase family DNA binding protein
MARQERKVTEKLLVSRRDAAAQLSISLRSLDKLVSEKRLGPVRRIGARVLIPRRVLEQFTENRGAGSNHSGN